MMAIKIEMLRCFCTVAQTGNLIEAADRLGRTQSAISMTLKQLEDHLGKKLFEGERKSQLSAIGQQVYEIARKNVRQYDQAVENIEATARAENGYLRIASVPSVAALVFPAILSEMTDRFPDVKIELRDTDTQQILDALSEGKADIGIASGYTPLNSVETTALFEDRFGLLCAADHPLAIRDLAPSISDIDPSIFLNNALCDQIKTGAFIEMADKSNLTIHNTHSLVTMVQTGKWITVLPQTIARYVPDGTIFRPLIDLYDKRQVFLYVRERNRFKELVSSCKEIIVNARPNW